MTGARGSGAEAPRQLAEIPYDDVVRGVRHGVRRTRGAPLGWPFHEGAPVPRLPGRHQVEVVAGDHEDLVRPIPEPLGAGAVRFRARLVDPDHLARDDAVPGETILTRHVEDQRRAQDREGYYGVLPSQPCEGGREIRP